MFKYNNPALKSRRQTLRNNSTEPEQILWYYLKNKNLNGYKFRRQYSVGAYVLDFYCPKIRLGIELDGDSHFTAKAQTYDRIRDKSIKDLGIKILRFTNIDVQENVEAVLEEIMMHLSPLE
jgi:very-short-patch-repair endonuclease